MSPKAVRERWKQEQKKNKVLSGLGGRLGPGRERRLPRLRVVLAWSIYLCRASLSIIAVPPFLQDDCLVTQSSFSVNVVNGMSAHMAKVLLLERCKSFAAPPPLARTLRAALSLTGSVANYRARYSRRSRSDETRGPPPPRRQRLQATLPHPKPSQSGKLAALVCVHMLCSGRHLVGLAVSTIVC
jgi:hypothetical protein